MAHVKVKREDLEKVMSLDDWLRTTDRVRKDKKLNDAWAQGNTDCAFRINNITGVQRSHRANDWNDFGGDLAERTHDKGLNYGTYLDLKAADMIIEVVGQTPWMISADRSEVLDNRKSAGAIDHEYTVTEGSTTTREVTVTDAVKVEMEAEFAVKGVGIKVTAGYEHTQATVNGQTASTERKETVKKSVPPFTYMEAHTVTKYAEKRYRIRVPIIMDGWVGLATSAQDVWDTLLPLYDFVSKDQVTRWLTLEMNVEARDFMTITYDAPTDTKETVDRVSTETPAGMADI